MFDPHSHSDAHGHHTWNEPSKIEASITVAFLRLSARAERPPGELYARATMR